SAREAHRIVRCIRNIEGGIPLSIPPDAGSSRVDFRLAAIRMVEDDAFRQMTWRTQTRLLPAVGAGEPVLLVVQVLALGVAAGGEGFGLVAVGVVADGEGADRGGPVGLRAAVGVGVVVADLRLHRAGGEGLLGLVRDVV